VVVEGNGHEEVEAGNGNNLIVGSLGKHTIQVGNGRNILIDGSVTGTIAMRRTVMRITALKREK
jgi:hypothetical protein